MTTGPSVRLLLAITIALRLCAASVAWTEAAESAGKTDRRAGSSLHGISTAAVLATAIKSVRTPVTLDADRDGTEGPRAVQHRLVRAARFAPAALRADFLHAPLASRPPPTL